MASPDPSSGFDDSDADIDGLSYHEDGEEAEHLPVLSSSSFQLESSPSSVPHDKHDVVSAKLNFIEEAASYAPARSVSSFPYAAPSYTTAVAPPSRTSPVRSSVACHYCRRRKRRCDGTLTKCYFNKYHISAHRHMELPPSPPPSSRRSSTISNPSTICFSFIPTSLDPLLLFLDNLDVLTATSPSQYPLVLTAPRINENDIYVVQKYCLSTHGLDMEVFSRDTDKSDSFDRLAICCFSSLFSDPPAPMVYIKKLLQICEGAGSILYRRTVSGEFASAHLVVILCIRLPYARRFLSHSIFPSPTDRSYRIMNLSYFTFIPPNDISPRALIHYVTTLSHIVFRLKCILHDIANTRSSPDVMMSELMTANSMLSEWKATLPPSFNLSDERFCQRGEEFESYRTNLLLGYHGLLCLISTAAQRLPFASKHFITTGYNAATFIALLARRVLETPRFEIHPFYGLECDECWTEDLGSVAGFLRRVMGVWRVATGGVERFERELRGLVREVIGVGDVRELVEES
ncbi:hypothetical protein BC829DRAFT_448273 [Chytridium lagenaria]|nr:hypothetical protein BC829DRAFT_448273 [Chytridium lagenaria]